MCPWFDEIVACVPARGRRLSLAEFEEPTHGLAPSHPIPEMRSTGTAAPRSLA